MHQEIAVVHQNPLGIAVAFDAGWALALFLELFANFIGDRLRLPRVSSGADEEKIGEGGLFAQIKDHDVAGLLGFRGPNG